MTTTSHIPALQKRTIPAQKSTIVNGFWEKNLLKAKVLWQFYRISLELTKSPRRALKLLLELNQKYQKALGQDFLTKVAKVGTRYYWRLGAPGFPSSAANTAYKNELKRFLPNGAPSGLRSLLFAITKQCPLHCEHCFEWDNLNQKEELSTEQIIQIVKDYQEYGTSQILLSGGETMLRVNDVYRVLKAAKPDSSDFWVLTSGLGLTEERAHRLKAAGLTGVMVSLDHFDPAEHDRFRGYEGAYDWAVQGIVNANKAGLVTTISLCPTRSFTTKENLRAYLELANKLGATFIQIVEPRAAGRYKGQAVDLEPEHLAILDEFYLTYNADPAYRNYPIINYIGHLQRSEGCSGSGNRFVYIDTDGDAHICPFCGDKVASALQFPVKDIVSLLSSQLCAAFETYGTTS